MLPFNYMDTRIGRYLSPNMKLKHGIPIGLKIGAKTSTVTYYYSTHTTEDIMYDQMTTDGEIDNWNGDLRLLTITYKNNVN